MGVKMMVMLLRCISYRINFSSAQEENIAETYLISNLTKVLLFFLIYFFIFSFFSPKPPGT